MLKRILISGGLSVVALSMSAAPLTPAEALTRLNSDSRLKAKSVNMSTDRLVYTAKTTEGENALYVFDNGSRYMILSADDAAAPLLGYSDSGRFDSGNLPPQLKWWMETYAEQIAAASEAGRRYSAPANVQREAIAPLLKSRWDQTTPFNNDCPVINGQLSVTGCVATSMAQLMNYFKYPEVGEGIIRYQTSTYKKTLLLNLGLKKFDWDNMLDVYTHGNYTDAQADAVAYLMKCCGYSVEMNYTPDESGAVSSSLAPALVNYFKYDKGTYYASRNSYAPSEWDEMIYSNLKNVGPVIYNGASSVSGGHSFVCDGYDGNGYYHFNWGWSGMSDGYFLLDALNPEALGVGGGSGGFNFRQGAVLGAQPDKGTAETHPQTLTQSGTLNATVTNGRLNFTLSDANPVYWMNAGPNDLSFKMGAIFEPVDGTPGETFTNVCTLSGSAEVTSLRVNYYFNSIIPSCSLDGMNDGKYKVTMAVQNQAANNMQFIPVLCDYRFNNYVYVTKSGSTYTVERPLIRSLKVTEVKLESDLILDCLAKVRVTVANDTDYEITQGFAPILSIDGTPLYVGESILVTLAPKTTESYDIYTSFYSTGETASGGIGSTYTLQVYNPADGISAIYEGAEETVTAQRSPGAPMMSLVSTDVKAEAGADGVYIAEAGTPVEFTSTVKVLRGYFAYPVYVGVYNAAGDLLMQKKVDDGVLFMNVGETQSITTDVLYTQAEVGEIYTCKLGYIRQYSFFSIGNGFRYKVTTSGVEEIAGETAKGIEIVYDRAADSVKALTGAGVSEIVVYDISGKKLAATSEESVELRGLAPGVVIVKARGIDGTETVKKIVR